MQAQRLSEAVKSFISLVAGQMHATKYLVRGGAIGIQSQRFTHGRLCRGQMPLSMEGVSPDQESAHTVGVVLEGIVGQAQGRSPTTGTQEKTSVASVEGSHSRCQGECPLVMIACFLALAPISQDESQCAVHITIIGSQAQRSPRSKLGTGEFSLFPERPSEQSPGFRVIRILAQGVSRLLGGSPESAQGDKVGGALAVIN
jgi:hypothetical protein